jgi:hypothetical protein
MSVMIYSALDTLLGGSHKNGGDERGIGRECRELYMGF